jgi:ATP-dependent Clp protease, protease subunit
MTKKKKEETEVEEEEVSIECDAPIEPRMVTLYGDLEEERAMEVINGVLSLDALGTRTFTIEEEGEVTERTYCQPIELFISTYGGSASDMFSIYDTMRMVDSPIYTVGIGKVMSAGVLLLAAGEKGHRRIGKNCRVMIHSVLGGSHGSIHNVENEVEEMRWTQERCIECLVEETSMSRRQLNSMLKQKTNIYLSAEEAVKYGIADKIV